MGFLTRGRGVSVHRTDCANAVSLMAEQQAHVVDVDWDVASELALFRAGVEVVAFDRSRLLRDVANALSEQHVNIVACSTHTGKDRVAKMRFEFELGDASHLESLLRTIRTIRGVYEAERVVSGG
jgi:GTP diphosphokinase / guanosine-3',5'-bis(diphosphate) 3'-diphosphatase